MTKLALALALALGLSSTALAADRVTCKDGTTATAARGACSGHGGVIKAAHEKRASSKASSKLKRAEEHARASVSKARHRKSEPKEKREASARERESAHRAQARAPEGALHRAAPRAREERSGAPSTDAAGAIARCADGTYSHASTHSGACSRHGGVAQWMDRR
jgi:hypothetical protein